MKKDNTTKNRYTYLCIFGFLDNKEYYSVFINGITGSNSDKVNNYNYIFIMELSFVTKLKGYDESLKYYEQTGECKSVIDYYINLINDK